jgi:hypothetical protein
MTIKLKTTREAIENLIRADRALGREPAPYLLALLKKMLH